uniref:DM13 domain-containing protein n=1 Tax=Heterorhabditis bacteriophora TaxID=37862 RepID=A0A1I7XN06_HETBA
MLLQAAVLLITGISVLADEINSYDPQYGVFIGELPNLADGDVKGKVYVVNDTTLQIINFTYNGNAPDLYFWLDHKETPTNDGVKIPSFEYGITPLGPYNNANRVVLILPGLHKLNNFRSFALYCYKYEHNFGSILIPENLVIPKPRFLSSELRGSRYSVGSGPILVVDRRTIKIFGFTFDADKAPDGYFFVGRGPNVAHDAGVKVPIRGRDTPELITAMNERYRGGQDMIIDLPDEYDINHIDWLAIYCYKFRVDFGHVTITNVSSKIPPYVPLQKRFDDVASSIDAWAVSSLLGTESRRNFTFQLGLPGGKKGYQSMTRARAAKYVWYVNGILADIYLKRGVTYTFIVEGGTDKSTSDFYNPLYLCDDQFGGYGKLSNDEREQVSVYSGSDPSSAAGRLCVWSNDDNVDPDQYSSFIDFRHTLRLKCESDKVAALFRFTPTENTPDLLYYQIFFYVNH